MKFKMALNVQTIKHHKDVEILLSTKPRILLAVNWLLCGFVLTALLFAGVLIYHQDIIKAKLSVTDSRARGHIFAKIEISTSDAYKFRRNQTFRISLVDKNNKFYLNATSERIQLKVKQPSKTIVLISVNTLNNEREVDIDRNHDYDAYIQLYYSSTKWFQYFQ